MSKSVSHRPGPRRRDRTFTGCLTCRRRKIKCDDPPFPCRKCQALNLDCVPPFSRNLRVVTPAFSPSGPHLLKISPISYEENEYQSLPHPPPAADAANPWDATQVTDGPQWCPIDLCPPYDPMIWAPCYGQALQVPHKDNAWDTGSAFSCFTAQDSCWTWGFPVQLADETPTHNTINLLGDGALLPSANKKEPLAFTSDGCIEGCGRSTVYITSDLTTGPSSDQRNDEYRSATESSAVDFIQSLPSVPSPLQNEIIPQTPESDTTTEFFRHYQQVMSRIFSVKDSRWNIYAYMLRISQRSSYPVRSGLLAWSGLHLSTQNVLQEPCATYHYHAAGCGAQELIRKASQLDNTAYPQSRDGSGMALTRTRTLLIVLFFLCQCDVITCNWSAYRSRMHTFKNALNKRWDTFRHSLQSTDYRILLWLSYLDVRASVWSPSGANCTELYSPTLLDIISKWEDVRSVYRKSRTYLHDAFQWEYPGPQLRDDMLQDPVNANLAETMSLISRIIALDKSLIGSQDDSSELQRQAIELDIEAIRSKLKDMDQVSLFTPRA